MAASTIEQLQNADIIRGSPISKSGRIAKRTLDLIGSIFLLLLLLPVIAVLALLIKLQDGGPVIYRRRVIGPNGEFNAFKLRSMCVDADKILEQDLVLLKEFEVSFKLKNDPRVTRTGAWIRKLSLDELPQLFNVLRGEMSLVGPRMITPPELNKYGEAGWIFGSMKPGLTGYWQVFGRQEVSYQERVQMDLHYVKTWSLWMDIRILVKTPMRVFHGAGAY
ncbi:MAG TPA: sugar transferase [Candidatus Angelobacter sp.]|nr:sugar transferase [Candidatus Angelobacter sp.]